MTLKLAFGYISVPFTVNGNNTTREVVQSAQNLIRNIFPVRDSRIEIILSTFAPHCELQDKLPESDLLLREFTTEEPFLYARIIRTVNNIEYIKTYRDGVIYFKREDALNGFNSNTSFLTDEQMQLLIYPNQRYPVQCTICYVNNVHTTPVYSCRHLFCTSCTTTWNSTCPLCRSS
jgi:hypothetical protein